MVNKNIDKFRILEYLDKVVEDNNLPLTKEEIILGLLNGKKNYIKEALNITKPEGIFFVFYLPIELNGNKPSASKLSNVLIKGGRQLLMHQMKHIYEFGQVDFSKTRIEDLDGLYEIDEKDIPPRREPIRSWRLSHS